MKHGHLERGQLHTEPIDREHIPNRNFNTMVSQFPPYIGTYTCTANHLITRVGGLTMHISPIFSFRYFCWVYHLIVAGRIGSARANISDTSRR